MNPKKPRRNCRTCQKECKEWASLYCSPKCINEWQHIDFVRRWKLGEESGCAGKEGTSTHVRRYMMEKAGYACERCRWAERNEHTGRIPLTLNHIDGGWRNNREVNLEVLCPNCHSLTSTYGSLNRGKGRPHSRKSAGVA